MSYHDVDALVDAHLAPLRVRNRQNHCATIKRWREWLAQQTGSPDLLDATGAHVQTWVSQMLDAGVLSVPTVRQRVSHLRAVYGDLLRDTVIESDPCRWVTAPPAPRRSHRVWLGRDDLIALLAASREAPAPVTAAVHLWALAGLRPAEPCAADATDLSHHGDLLVLTLADRKGGDSDRVSIPRPAAEAVEAARDGRSRGPLLLHPRLPRRLDLPTARSELRKVARAAGVDAAVTPYGLRHSFITLALEAGVPERDVAASAGHSTTSQIPGYDRLRANISIDRHAGHRLTGWLGLDSVDATSTSDE
ncbi:MAG: tyrosine-type recombinase/integrase [Micrococcales bacterium]|nr:tyrosine-type recombinase/integrase [Micrococcales bacterium]